jgi:hypothetical protein
VTKAGSGTAVVSASPAAKTVPNNPAVAGKPSATPMGAAKPAVVATPASAPAKPAAGAPAPFQEEESTGSTKVTTAVAFVLALLTWGTAVALGLSYFQFI